MGESAFGLETNFVVGVVEVRFDSTSQVCGQMFDDTQRPQNVRAHAGIIQFCEHNWQGIVRIVANQPLKDWCTTKAECAILGDRSHTRIITGHRKILESIADIGQGGRWSWWIQVEAIEQQRHDFGPHGIDGGQGPVQGTSKAV